MTFIYFLRLGCLSLAVFFLVYAASALAVSLLGAKAIRFGRTMRPRTAAQFLFTLRTLPFLLAAITVAAVCVPSYLWLEPRNAPEGIGLACGVFGFLGLLLGCVSATRLLNVLVVSHRRQNAHDSEEVDVPVAEEILPVGIVEQDAPVLALTGVIDGRVVISRGVLQTLSSSELDSALRHEVSHSHSRDNLKRLTLFLVPDLFSVLGGCAALERQWVKLTEWAADDEAVAGIPQRAVSLASALVAVARMGTGPRLAVLHTSFVASDADFAERVERLLNPETFESSAERNSCQSSASRLRRTSFLFAASFAVLLAGPAALSSAHRLLELLVR